MKSNDEELTDNVKKRITIQELRQFKGFDSVDDSIGEEIITALEQISLIFYSMYKKDVLKNEKDFDEL